MSETLDNVEGQEAKRPTFLTVLCVLSFIGSGWGIISALAMKDPGLAEYAGYYYWVMLLLNIGTLYGAFAMWKMQKMGLYIWTAAEVIGVVLMWVVVKGYLASMMAPIDSLNEIEGMEGLNTEVLAAGGNALVEGVMNTALIIGSIFPAVFVLLYWMNAKHLK
ncbi:MAG: hypothetical protein RI883_2269 [Bacteroidota bacterium]